MDTYKVLFCNEYGRKVWEDIVGKKCWQAIQHKQGPCSFCTNDKLLDSSGRPTEGCSWEFQEAETGKWFELRDRAIRWIDGKMVRLAIATDITKRKAEREGGARKTPGPAASGPEDGVRGHPGRRGGP